MFKKSNNYFKRLSVCGRQNSEYKTYNSFSSNCIKFLLNSASTQLLEMAEIPQNRLNTIHPRYCKTFKELRQHQVPYTKRKLRKKTA